MKLENLKFPIGTHQIMRNPNQELIEKWIQDIEEFPGLLEKKAHNISLDQLHWRYRPGGWTIKQVIHHCSDSHMNSFIRFKLALTETRPEIRPYEEDKWAELPDGIDDNVLDSIHLLKSLHKKWTFLLRNLSSEQLKMEFIHPSQGEIIRLDQNIGLYSWHGRHHLAHIQAALDSHGSYV